MSSLILLADDNDADLELAKLALDECGIDASLVVAHDGIAAIDALRTCEPQLVIVDIKMPGADGFAVLAAVRNDARTAQVPVVVMSSSTDDDDRFQALAGGATRYWTKPSRFDEIVKLFATLPSLAPLQTKST